MWMVYSSFCEFHDLSSKNKQTKNPKLVYYSDSPCYLFLKDVQLSSHPLPLDLTSFLASLPQCSLHCIKWSNNYKNRKKNREETTGKKLVCLLPSPPFLLLLFYFPLFLLDHSLYCSQKYLYLHLYYIFYIGMSLLLNRKGIINSLQ